MMIQLSFCVDAYYRELRLNDSVAKRSTAYCKMVLFKINSDAQTYRSRPVGLQAWLPLTL